ncbi:autotransporter domain-containing protein [Pseudomonas sp. PDM04]|uniref:autotransporter outer membrane beta-barrel domain-containing protein n=1 Tax=Pseudomonas sp. PDM04 TaxID=2769296 RepID=UPI00177CE330|nr:autotransporter outer membrane beta-barrel domain-containing protein [Pseudomonas sp. PDM04]MBD9441806.1 autotransporter domain-containing protein [Pseudomonas sp. PDM04]
MSVQPTHRLKHLVLSVALAIGYSEFSLAQEPAARPGAGAKPAKARKKTVKPVAAPNKIVVGVKKPGPITPLAPASPRPEVQKVEFGDDFYDALDFDVAAAKAYPDSEDPFRTFKDAWTTQHTLVSAPIDSLQLREVDDLLVVNKGAAWKGQLDGGAGRNVLLLNARSGGSVGETHNFGEMRVARGHWTLDHSFEGKAHVLAGASLFNQGSIHGDAHVYRRAMYGGPGSVRNLYVEGALLVSKNNAPVIAGDLVLDKGAVVTYAVSPTEGPSAISVAGTASLGDAQVHIAAMPGNYATRTEHVLVNAGKIEGEFGAVTSNLAFLTPTLSRNETQAFVSYGRNSRAIEETVESPNEKALARSVDTPEAAEANSSVRALLGSNMADASAAIEQLTASQHGHLAKATRDSASPVSASMLSAMRQLSGSAMNNAPQIAARNDKSRVWIQALGNSGRVDSHFDDPLKHSTQGLVLGADWRLAEQWHVGVLGGRSETKLDARQFDGRLDSWHLGVYAVRQDGPFALRLGATHASHDATSKRRVAFNGFSDRLKGRHDASTQHAFIEAGLNVGRGSLTVEPFANLGYQRYERDSYTEKGGDAALKVRGQSQDNFSSTFGLRVAKLNVLDNGMQLTPRLSAGWKHTYGDLQSDTQQQLVKGGKRFEVSANAGDRSLLALDAGVDLALSSQQTVGLALTSETGGDTRNYGVMGQWQLAF